MIREWLFKMLQIPEVAIVGLAGYDHLRHSSGIESQTPVGNQQRAKAKLESVFLGSEHHPGVAVDVQAHEVDDGHTEISTDGLSLEDNERSLLVRALEKTEGNQTQAARLLRITRDTLRYKMKKFNLR